MEKLKILISMILSVSLFFGCGKKSSSDSSSSSSGDTSDSSLTLQGSLDVSAAASLALAEGIDDKSFDLAASSYDIYCVTFEETPKACKATVTDNKFVKECSADGEELAGKSFGCFLRQDNVTLGSVAFDIGATENESSMALAAGKFIFNVSLSSDGTVTAVVDTENAENTAYAKKDTVSGDKTTLASLTGEWELSCLEDDGKCFGDEGEKKLTKDEGIYINDFTVGEKRKVAIWENKAARDRCIVSDNEALPKFKIGDIPLDFTSMAKLDESIKNAWAVLPTAIQDLLKAESEKMDKMFNKSCDQQSSLFKADNCKIYKAEEEKKEETRDGRKHEWIELKKPTSYAAATAFTGTVTEESMECIDFEDWDPNKEREERAKDPTKQHVPPCPHNVTISNGKGTMKFYKDASDNKPLMLLCKDTMSDNPMFFRLEATSVAAAVAAMVSGSGGNPNCKDQGSDAKDSLAGISGKTAGYLNEIRRNIIEIMSFNDEHAEQMCQGGSGQTDPTDYKVCPQEGQGSHMVCGMLGHKMNEWGLTFDNGGNSRKLKLKDDTTDGSRIRLDDHSTAKLVCKTKYDQDTVAGGNPPNIDPAFKLGCVTQFAALTAAEQIAVFLKLQNQYQPIFQRLACDSTLSAEKTALSTLKASSCVPRVYLGDTMDKTTDQIIRVLKCEGSGNCYNEAKTIFKGKLPGRHMLSTLKLGYGKAFSFSQMEKHEMMQPSMGDEGEFKSCTFTHRIIFSCFKESDTQAQCQVEMVEKDSCNEEGGDQEGSGLAEGDDKTPKKAVFKVRLTKK